MMKKVTSALLVCLLCLLLAVPALAASGQEHLLDEADLLTEREEATLVAQLQRISDTYGTQIAVCTVSFTPGGDADAYIEMFYDRNGFGYGPDRSGVLLVVCMDIREFRILSNGAAADALTPGRIDEISEMITRYLPDGEYAAAFDEFAYQCAYYLDGQINGFPFAHGRTLLIAIIVGLAIGLIVAFSLKGQLKSVRIQRQANDYVKPGSMQLRQHSDLFLYNTVRRTRRESSNSSRSGGGGSRHVGGGRF